MQGDRRDDGSGRGASVAVIGLGNMGARLAATFLDAGCSLTVWNRTAARAEPLAARGARVAATAAAAATAAPVVIVCVARYEHVREALGDLAPGAMAGHTLVNLTWGTPEDAEEMERWVHARGGAYIDGGIPVLPASIGRPATELVYSGPPEVWERHAEVLRLLGGASRHVGAQIGAANVVSLAIPGAFFNVAYEAFLEGAAYAARHGVEPSELRSLVQGALRLLEETVEDAARAIADEDYATDEGTMLVQLDGMLMVRDAMEREGQRGTLIWALCDVLERGVAAGHAQAAQSAVFPMLRDGG